MQFIMDTDNEARFLPTSSERGYTLEDLVTPFYNKFVKYGSIINPDGDTPSSDEFEDEGGGVK